MASTLYSPAELLYQRAASVRAVQGGEVNQFSAALAVLEQVSARLGAPLAIVGGLAAIHHRALVTTLDIDIVVPSNRLDEFLVVAVSLGLELKRRSPRGWHTVMFRDGQNVAEINVIPEGEKSPRDPDYAPPTPSPAALGVATGLGYANFASWVALKLVTNRDKDRYHLVEALKHASQTELAEAVVKLRGMNAVYLRRLEELMRAAEGESQETW